MEKDFDAWNEEKRKLNASSRKKFYHVREIWWCAFGLNVGREQVGKGVEFERPVFILRGFNAETFFGVALTSKTKEGRYYFPVGMVAGQEALANLSQVRIFDVKRLKGKIITLNKGIFEQVKSACRQALFPDVSSPEIISRASRGDDGQAEAIVVDSILSD
jgi:mRNA interferase MazF